MITFARFSSGCEGAVSADRCLALPRPKTYPKRATTARAVGAVKLSVQESISLISRMLRVACGVTFPC